MFCAGVSLNDSLDLGEMVENNWWCPLRLSWIFFGLIVRLLLLRFYLLINIKPLTKITGISARNRGHDSNKSEFETL